MWGGGGRGRGMGLGSQDDEGASEGLHEGAVNCLLLQSSCLGS